MGRLFGKTGGKENKISFHCQDTGRTLLALVVAEKVLLLLGEKRQQTSSSQTLPHPAFFTFFLEKEVWISCSTVTKHAFLSVAEHHLSSMLLCPEQGCRH